MTARERMTVTPIASTEEITMPVNADEDRQETQEVVSAVTSEALYQGLLDLRQTSAQLRVQAARTGHAEFDEMGQRLLSTAGLFRQLLLERRDDPYAVHYLALLRDQETRSAEPGARQIY